jgi:hypothetical protein
MKKKESALIIGMILFMFSISTSAGLFKKKTGEEAAPAVQDQVTDIQTAAGKEIVIQGTKKMECAVFVIPDPIRMMINLTGVVLAPEIPRTLLVNQGLMKTIRINEFRSGDKVLTRMEVALTQDAEYTINREGKSVTVTLEPKTAKEKDDTIPIELYSRAQRATTELIETGEMTPEIHPQVVVPTSPPGPSLVVSPGTAPATLRAETGAMKQKVQYPGTATRVMDVKHRVSENQFQILIQTDGTVGNYEEFTMNRPARLVIDLLGIKGSVPRSSYPVNQAGIKRIRLGQHPDKTRIVLDFSTKKIPQYYVMRTKGGIMIAVPMSSK